MNFEVDPNPDSGPEAGSFFEGLVVWVVKLFLLPIFLVGLAIWTLVIVPAAIVHGVRSFLKRFWAFKPSPRSRAAVVETARSSFRLPNAIELGSPHETAYNAR